MTLLNQGLWWPSNETPEEQTLAMVAQQQQTKKSSNNSTKSKSNSRQGSKAMEKTKRVPLLPTHLENLETPSNGMGRPIIGVPPIINTPTGIHTRWRSVTPTRKW